MCLLSALVFHGLTTQVPGEVWVALPRGSRTPRLDRKLRIVRFAEAALTEGRTEQRIEGVPVMIYSPAKSVADCFKFQNKIGLDVAREALRECVRQRKATDSGDPAFRPNLPSRAGDAAISGIPSMNSPASIRARLLNVSKQAGEDFQAILTRYAIERFLYRLGASEQRESFILKGAMLFVAWQGNLHRRTKDLDLLGFGSSSVEDVARRIREIAATSGDDGIAFDADSVVTEVIKEDAEYEGVRAKLVATLEQAKIRMQIDVGFGDAVQPEPKTGEFPPFSNK